MAYPRHGYRYHEGTWIAPCRAATTANITIATALNAADVLDGVTLAAGDRVLVKDQSTGSQNGVYVVGVTPARAADFAASGDIVGSVVVVSEGTVNADTAWLCTTNAPITVDTTALVFAAFGGGAVAAHEADASDAHDASAVSFSPAAGIAATDVQAAIVEDAGDLAAHLADTAAAHAASAIAFTPNGSIAATDVQAAIQEVRDEAVGGGAHDTSHEDGGADEISLTGLSGVPAELTTHAAAADPHTGYVREADANWIDLTDSGATTLHSHAGGGSLSAPTFVAVGTSATGTGDITPGLPAGHTTDDILLLFCQSSNQAVTAPAGWTKLGPVVGFGTAAAAGSMRLTTFWKRHDGSEVDPTVADPGDHAIAQIMAIRGCVTTGDPFVVCGQGRKTTASTSTTAHPGATHVDNCMVVNAWAHALDSASAVFSSPVNADLTGLTEQIDVATADGTGGGIGVVTGVKATVGAFVGTTVTETSTTDVDSTFYLVPAGATMAGAIDRQEFITTGADTWTKRAGAKAVEIIGIGGGASGSAGRNAATAAGGGGGGGGASDRSYFGAVELPATLTVTVGAGAPATANTDGAASTAGGETSVDAGSIRLVRVGGGFAATASATGSGGAGGGGGGLTAPGAPGAQTNFFGSQPAIGGTGATTGAAGSNQIDFGGGGGGGGGTTQAGTQGGSSRRGGGGGGGGRSDTNFSVGGAGSAGLGAPGGATVGASGGTSAYPEIGGGGGASGNSAAGPGGAGGWPGGGGGGGGRQAAAQRGGAGGDGVVTIVTVC